MSRSTSAYCSSNYGSHLLATYIQLRSLLQGARLQGTKWLELFTFSLSTSVSPAVASSAPPVPRFLLCYYPSDCIKVGDRQIIHRYFILEKKFSPPISTSETSAASDVMSSVDFLFLNVEKMVRSYVARLRSVSSETHWQRMTVLLGYFKPVKEYLHTYSFVVPFHLNLRPPTVVYTRDLSHPFSAIIRTRESERT